MGFKSADCAGQDISWRLYCFFFVFNILLTKFNKGLGHYLVWEEFLEPQAVLQIGSCDAAVGYNCRCDLICSSPVANLRLFNSRKFNTQYQSLLHTLRLLWYRGLQLFHQFFDAHRPSYLTQRFQTLIQQSKGLYFTVLLSSLYAPWPTRTIWHRFASSTEASRQKFRHIGQLHRVFPSKRMLTYSFHDFGSVVQWCLECNILTFDRAVNQ